MTFGVRPSGPRQVLKSVKFADRGFDKGVASYILVWDPILTDHSGLICFRNTSLKSPSRIVYL